MTERTQPNRAQYARDTILDSEQAAEWLGVSVKQLERMDVPCVFLGSRTRRFIVGHVLDHFDRQLRRVS